jgi:hypothetical protein
MRDKVKIEMPVGFSVEIVNTFKNLFEPSHPNSDFCYLPIEGIARPRVLDFDLAFRVANQRGQEVQVAVALEDYTASIHKAWRGSFHTHDQSEPQ